MITLIAKWLIVALSFLLAAYLVPGIAVESFYTALILAFVWGVINLTAKPILTILTLPISFITLGLFSFVINALLLWFLGTVIKGFEVQGFVAAFLGALVIAGASWAGELFTQKCSLGEQNNQKIISLVIFNERIGISFFYRFSRFNNCVGAGVFLEK